MQRIGSDGTLLLVLGSVVFRGNFIFFSLLEQRSWHPPGLQRKGAPAESIKKRGTTNETQQVF